ncbi:MAG: hypothetical protein H6945_01535 [Zoogloeaceae bacterium]|nr:hypothetical protein [Rhodocyclaceae bacterium]MCP5234407.1 hypothetical protein [Zoogloeaceae bacterium]
MPGLFGGNRNTRELTATAYTVERGGGSSRVVPTLLAVCCVVLAAYAAYQVLREQFAPASRVSQLEAENRQLRRQLVDETERLSGELTDARLQTEMDAATRAELERQLEELTTQLKEVSEELSFFKQAKKSKP